jgi:general secretion pathway protein F
VIVVGVLLTLVVPKITRLLTSRNQELPAPTKLLVFTSDVLQSYWLLILIAILLLMIAFNFVTSTETGRFRWDQFKLKMPIVGDLLRKQAVARFATTLATLLRSGVPALQALEVTKNVLGNKVLDKALTSVHDHVLEGTDIATPMKMTGTFPPMVCYMVGVGEQAGNLEEMLERVASSYDEEVELATAKMTSFMEPMIIVALAVVVGFIVMAIVLPLLKLQNVK